MENIDNFSQLNQSNAADNERGYDPYEVGTLFLHFLYIKTVLHNTVC